MNELLSIGEKAQESLRNTVANALLCLKGKDRDDMIAKLRRDCEKFCGVEEEMKIPAKPLDRDAILNYEGDHFDNDSDKDSEEDLDNICYEDETEDESKVAADYFPKGFPDISNNVNYKEFERVVSVLSAAFCRETAEDPDADDAELQVTENAINLIDPITKARMTDPVINTECSHVYDRGSITELLKMNPASLCPVPGCKSDKPLRLEDMKADIVTRIYLYGSIYDLSGKIKVPKQP